MLGLDFRNETTQDCPCEPLLGHGGLIKHHHSHAEPSTRWRIIRCSADGADGCAANEMMGVWFPTASELVHTSW